MNQTEQVFVFLGLYGLLIITLVACLIFAIRNFKRADEAPPLWLWFSLVCGLVPIIALFVSIDHIKKRKAAKKGEEEENRKNSETSLLAQKRAVAEQFASRVYKIKNLVSESMQTAAYLPECVKTILGRCRKGRDSTCRI